uniref:hypothetical protein n=1 Tax=Streptococcus pluranimalium TaxID=82348 RepID=UPI003F69209C
MIENLIIIENNKDAIDKIRGHRYYETDFELSENELNIFIEALRNGKRLAYLSDDETMTFGLAL